MGNLNEAQRFFADAGYACKSNYNPADHYIWELSIIEGTVVQDHRSNTAEFSNPVRDPNFLLRS